MTKFLVLYKSSATAAEQMAASDPAAAQEAMGLWMAWMEKACPAIVDGGSPLGDPMMLPPDAGQGDRQVGGYSILQGESLEEIIDRACRRVPKLAGAEVMRGVTGVYDMTPDSRPLLGEAPGHRGLFVCAGFSGMGFKISPAIGLVMSELVIDGAAKSVDITAFRPNRFAENQPIQAEYEYVDD